MNTEPAFKLGRIVMTSKIAELIERDEKFSDEIRTALKRYIKTDWSDMCEEDIQTNNEALESGEDRIFAQYATSFGKIYIITEWDRSCTTILFADEY